MDKKYEKTEAKARVGQVITNGNLDCFVLAIKKNYTLLQCISTKPDSFKNGEIVIASGLKQYHVTGDGEDKIEWQWDNGSYLSNAFMGNILNDLLDPKSTKENRLKVLLYNAIVKWREDSFSEWDDEEEWKENVLEELGMTEEEYKEIMEDN